MQFCKALILLFFYLQFLFFCCQNLLIIDSIRKGDGLWKTEKRKEKGLIFVGLDIIGDRLTEINVTSPTCIREIEAEFPVSITGMLMDAIEARLQQQ